MSEKMQRAMPIIRSMCEMVKCGNFDRVADFEERLDADGLDLGAVWEQIGIIMNKEVRNGGLGYSAACI